MDDPYWPFDCVGLSSRPSCTCVTVRGNYPSSDLINSEHSAENGRHYDKQFSELAGICLGEMVKRLTSVKRWCYHWMPSRNRLRSEHPRNPGREHLLTATVRTPKEKTSTCQ